MIATRRGLLVLLAIVALLAVLVVREARRHPPEVVDRAIVPGLDPDRVTELTWDRSPLPEVKVTRAEGDWTWASSGGWAKADVRVVRDVLAALRAARWHRRAEVAAAGKVHAQLSAKVGTTTRVIGVGAPLEGTEQQWLVVGDHALLVDRWVARALEPDPLALRMKRPFERVDRTRGMSLEVSPEVAIRIRLDGKPWNVIEPHVVLPRAELLSTLERALEAIEIVRLSRTPPDDPIVLYVQAHVAMRFLATCPDDPALSWVTSDIGTGCVTRAAYDFLLVAVKALSGPVPEIIERRLAPFEASSVLLADGTTLDLARSPLVDGKPADPAAVTELLAVLSAPAELGSEAVTPVKAQMRIVLKDGGSVVLELLGDGLVRRAGETMALKLTPAAYAALTRGAKDLADRSVWTEEPTTIMAIQIDAITYARGAVIGEWTRTPAGPVDGARVEALVAALATLKRSPEVASFTKAHDVTLVVAGAAGTAVRRELTVGARVQGGCTAWVKSETVRLPAKVCDSVTALAK